MSTVKTMSWVDAPQPPETPWNLVLLLSAFLTFNGGMFHFIDGQTVRLPLVQKASETVPTVLDGHTSGLVGIAWDSVSAFLIFVSVLQLLLATPHPVTTSTLRAKILALISIVLFINGAHAGVTVGAQDITSLATCGLSMLVSVANVWGMSQSKKILRVAKGGLKKE